MLVPCSVSLPGGGFPRFPSSAHPATRPTTFLISSAHGHTLLRALGGVSATNGQTDVGC